MSDQSPEAIVAGEAAAAAVEEVQARETLNESVAVTAEVAIQAEDRATEAQMDAQTAVQAASEAIGATSAVSEQAATAQETAEVAAATAVAAREENQETRTEMQILGDKMDMLIAHLTRESEPQQTSGVQEVEVHNAAASTENSSIGEESSDSRPPRRGARRLSRRSTGQ